MSEGSLAIEARGLRKEFGPKVAVAALDLAVERGEVFGFLGPNGAGKTTSVKMLLGLAAPTAGEASLLGIPISDPEARRRDGFLPEHFRFHDWLCGAEFLDLHGKLHHIPRETRRQRIHDLLELVGLTEAAERRLGAYSKGMQQRIGLAQALINDPEVVFLDEPTSGLDPLGRRMVRDVIRHLRERGVTVFLNSHLLSEVEVTCDRVAFVAQGIVRKVMDLKHYQEGLLEVDVRVGRVSDDLIAGLQQFSSRVDVAEGNGNQLTLHLPDDAALPAIARWIVAQGVDLYALSPRAISLEDLFVSIVGDKLCETS